MAKGLLRLQDPGTNRLVNDKLSRSLTAETATLHFTGNSTGRAHRWWQDAPGVLLSRPRAQGPTWAAPSDSCFLARGIKAEQVLAPGGQTWRQPPAHVATMLQAAQPRTRLKLRPENQVKTREAQVTAPGDTSSR